MNLALSSFNLTMTKGVMKSANITLMKWNQTRVFSTKTLETKPFYKSTLALQWFYNSRTSQCDHCLFSTLLKKLNNPNLMLVVLQEGGGGS